VFIRTKKVQKGGRTYRYAQIVESFRRAEDGQPRQRVVASLGQCSELMIENLRVALAAAKKGDALVLPTDSGLPIAHAGHDFLPISLVLDFAERCGIAGLLTEVLDTERASVPVSQVVRALIAHRLVAPGSKLSAVRWVAGVAAPELFGFKAGEFNNSRVHRALERVHECRGELQAGLGRLFREETEAGHTLFFDVTDTWFEGAGPSMAQMHRTRKDKAMRRKIGIVLACSRKGLPLRWEVVHGRRHDSKSMLSLAAGTAGVPWMASLPCVFDRAMGKPAHLANLHRAGVRYVTLLTKDTFASLLPSDGPDLTNLLSSGRDDAGAQAAMIERVEGAGFVKVGRRSWCRDLGVHHSPSESPTRQATLSKRAARARSAVLQHDELVTEKEASGRTFLEIADERGISRGQLGHLRLLAHLHPEVADEVREGRSSLNIRELQDLGRLGLDEQLRMFESSHGVPTTDDSDPVPPVRLLWIYDPVVFAADRHAALSAEDEVCSKVEALNDKWREGHQASTAPSAERAVRRLLAHHGLTDCFDFQVYADGFLRAKLERKETAWQRKRATDGCRLFAVHPELDLTGEEVLELYSAKCAIENDFRVIKSVVKLRPVHHQNDDKVRAHVDICVLALAIERCISAAAPEGTSAAAVLETLASVRLLTVSPNADSVGKRVMVKPTEEQHRLLRDLGALQLLNHA